MSSVTERQLSDNKERFNFSDIDGTLTREDTGEQTFIESGRTSEEFEQTMKQKHEEGKAEPPEGKGNELVLTLEQMDSEDVERMRQAGQSIDVSYRDGIDAVVESLDRYGAHTVAHSAGWEVPIEAVTNGHFDSKIYAELGEDGSRLNGRYQKPARMQNYMLENGVDDPVEDGDVEANYIGDSNTDSEALKYADATGGLGIAIGESLDEATGVEEATIYSADPEGDHDLAAAVLHYHNTEDIEETRRFVDQYDLDPTRGEAVPGELAINHDRAEYVNNLIEEVKEI